MGLNDKRVAPPAAYASPVSVERVGDQVNEDRAFELLRDHSQRSGRKAIDVAKAVAESHPSCSRERGRTAGAGIGSPRRLPITNAQSTVQHVRTGEAGDGFPPIAGPRRVAS